MFSCLFSCTQETSQEFASHENKKIFYFSRTIDPKTFDPQAQFDVSSGDFVSSIYDTLISYHYLKRPYELTPSLLESMPEKSKDGLTLTFKIRQGIHFHDNDCFLNGKGRELIADDVIYTIKRFADSRVNTLSWFLLDDLVEGLDEYREDLKKNKDTHYDKFSISGIKKISSHSLSIKLKRDNPLALYAFASSSLSIVPREAVEKYGRKFNTTPVGTGPFILKEFNKKQTAILIKNPNYFMTYPKEGSKKDAELGFLSDAGKKLPLLDEVHIDFIPEAQPAMLKFKQGEIFWIGLDRDNFTQMAYREKDGSIALKDSWSDKYSLYQEPGLSSVYLVLNLKDKTLGKNKDLRKALAYTIDFEDKINLLNNGRAQKLHSIVPQTIWGSEDEIGNYGYDFNLSKAKEYLAKAGYPEGKNLPPLTLTLQGSSSSHRDYFEYLRNAFSKIGVTLKPDYQTWSSFLKATERGDFQLASSAWQADYPDPENFFLLFYGPNKPPGQNSSSFSNKEYDSLYEQMRFMPNSPKRLEIITRMAKILQDEVPVIYDSSPVISGLTQKWVKNFKRNMMISKPFKFLDIDKNLKDKILAKSH